MELCSSSAHDYVVDSVPIQAVRYRRDLVIAHGMVLALASGQSLGSAPAGAALFGCSTGPQRLRRIAGSLNRIEAGMLGAAVAGLGDARQGPSRVGKRRPSQSPRRCSGRDLLSLPPATLGRRSAVSPLLRRPGLHIRLLRVHSCKSKPAASSSRANVGRVGWRRPFS